jgi:signal transduction histidine kinase
MSIKFPKLHFGLRTKFVLIISLLILTTSALLSGFLIERQTSLIQRELGKRAESLVRNLAFNSEYGVLVENKQLLFNLMKGLSQEEDVQYILIQDKKGNTLAEWNRIDQDHQMCIGELAIVQQVFKEQTISQRYFIAKGEEFSNFSYPIKTTRVERSKEELGLVWEEKKDQITKEENIGVAHIGMCLRHMHKEIADMKTIVVLLTATVVAVGVALTIFLVNIFLKPTKMLVRATERIASGDLSHMMEVSAKDEIGTLASSFNRMITSLKESREKIEEYNKTLETKVKERTAELENALKSLKEAQVQLIQAEKMVAVGQLAAGVAHELNNPLGGILGYSQFALEKIRQKPISHFDQEDTENFLQYLKDIEQQTKRCRAIIQSLLKFSRESRKEEFEPIDVNSVLRETFIFIKHQLEKNGVKLVERLTESLPPINGQPNQLQQVFTNLILNGVQAMPGGGTLTIHSRTKKDHQAVEISFTDTGLGISEENLDKIFEPFFTTKKVGEGTGLGLSVSYGLIKNHGGEIKVESIKGKGTTFTVILPIQWGKAPSPSEDEKVMAICRE